MVEKVTFVGFRGGRSPQSSHLDPPVLLTSLNVNSGQVPSMLPAADSNTCFWYEFWR